MDSGFSIDVVEKFLSPFHTQVDKDRILRGLAQFTDLGSLDRDDPNYEADLEKVVARLLVAYAQNPFYSSFNHQYFLQGDIVAGVQLPIWKSDISEYRTGSQTSLLISNACDCDLANDKQISKYISFVPVTSLNGYLNILQRASIQRSLAESKTLDVATRIAEAKVKEYSGRIKLQKFTNLLYLPASPNGQIEERIALLDRPFTYDIKQWKSNYAGLLQAREGSLSQWAYYLFMFKLTFHFCRLPEQPERND